MCFNLCLGNTVIGPYYNRKKTHLFCQFHASVAHYLSHKICRSIVDRQTMTSLIASYISGLYDYNYATTELTIKASIIWGEGDQVCCIFLQGPAVFCMSMVEGGGAVVHMIIIMGG